MSLRYTIDAFRTKQALDKSYRQYSEAFKEGAWWGEYNREYDPETVRNILNAFENDRTRSFKLIHQSDYRDTYHGKVSGVDIYLKHYRTFQAKYSRTTIIKRNILRRTLAKKSFALSFLLRQRGLPVIRSLFYGGKGEAHIPAEALYASISVPGAVTLDYYFEKLMEPGKRYGSYTEDFVRETPEFDPNEILFAFGRFVGEIIRKEVHIFHKELYANTLISPHGDTFRLTLCDLDVVSAISPFTREKRERELEKFRRYLQQRLRSFDKSPELISSFRKGVESCNR